MRMAPAHALIHIIFAVNFAGHGFSSNREVKMIDTRLCIFGTFRILEPSSHYSVVILRSSNLKF
jgi:hypothetical protein